MDAGTQRQHHKHLQDAVLERRRAELFSEYAVAERLMQIYTSL